MPPLTLEQVFNNTQYYKVSESLAKGYLWEILSAVKALHHSGFTHRNINMQSLLLANIKGASAQLVLGSLESAAKHSLTDYEFSKSTSVDASSKHQEMAGSAGDSESINQEKHSLAPELLLGQTMHTFASDIWAVGCIMFHMLCGYHPFKEDCKVAVLFRIFKTLGTPGVLDCPTLQNEVRCPWFCENVDKYPQWEGLSLEELLPPATSPEASDLLKQLLQLEPTRRISAELALLHPLFSDFTHIV